MADLPPDLELGPKMLACSERERKLVWFYVTGGGDPKVAGNGKAAGILAGYSDSADGAKVRASIALHRERVIEACEEVGKREFRTLLVPVIQATRALIEKPDHPDHAKTLQSTLSRLGISERTAVDVNVSGEVTHNHTDAALNDLRSLLALGVPRAELERTFGVSGLQRYERMLAEQDGKRAPLMIEGMATEMADAHKD